MSAGRDADLELLRRVTREWERGEFWNAEPYAEDVVFVRSGPDEGEYRGLEGFYTGWRDFLAAWEDFRIETDRVLPGRDGMYVLYIRLRGVGRGSGLRVEEDVANVITVRAGKIARSEMFWDREAALRAAGAEAPSE